MRIFPVNQYFFCHVEKKSSVQNIQVFFGHLSGGGLSVRTQKSDKPKQCDKIQNDHSKHVMFNLPRNVPQKN